MNDKQHENRAGEVSRSAKGVDRIGIPGATAPGAERIASRRYILLKGIGRGTAILAAAAPIKTLASTPSVTANGQICSISGTQSTVHSQPKGLPQCAGFMPSRYADITKWPNYSAISGNTTYTVGNLKFNEKSTFKKVFGTGSGNGLLDIMRGPDNQERHWISALLSAIRAPMNYVFPYSPQEVLDLYNSAQQGAALTFFTGFMETIPS